MRRTLFATLLLCATIAQAAPVRKAIVLAKGQRVDHEAAGSVLTVTTSPLALTDSVARVQFDQYGQTVTLQAVKPGEVKLMLEYTDGRIGEILNVIVTDQAVADRQRFVASSVAAIEGLSAESVYATASHILIAGEVFSAADLGRCESLESSSGGKTKGPVIVCGVRLRSSAAALFPSAGYEPSANVEIREAPVAAAAGGIEGLEGDSIWRATLRLGDVPFLEMASNSRPTLVTRAAKAVIALETAVDEWRRNADAGRTYPTTFGLRRAGNSYEMTMQWKFDQGTRGAPLIEVSPDDVLEISSRSGGGVERLLQWWAATLHDAFRMYFMASIPIKTTPPGTETPLLAVYNKALVLHGAHLERQEAPVAFAQGYTALRWSTGTDPLGTVLTTVPGAFQPEPIQVRQ
ncbi:MAG: hypothetical protein ACYC7A_06860 [Thermoanaerobaculia bacterium]